MSGFKSRAGYNGIIELSFQKIKVKPFAVNSLAS